MLHHLAAMSVPNMAATPSTLRRPAVLVQSPLMRCTCPKVTSDNISIITIYPRACLFVCLAEVRTSGLSRTVEIAWLLDLDCVLAA